MLRSFVTCVAFVLLALNQPGLVLAAGEQDFFLVNETGDTVMRAFVSRSTTNSWEEDVLGSSVLPNGNRHWVSFSRNYRGCLFDIKVELSSGRTLTKWNQNLCGLAEVRFNGGERTASRYY